MGQNNTVTKKQFQDGLNKLMECFPNATAMSPETIVRYWEYLGKSFTGEDFESTVEKIIVTERFFPSISVFFKNKEMSLAKKAF